MRRNAHHARCTRISRHFIINSQQKGFFRPIRHSIREFNCNDNFLSLCRSFLGSFIEDKKIKWDASVISSSTQNTKNSSRHEIRIRFCEFGLNVGFNLITTSFLPFPLSVRFSSTFENHARSIIIPSLRSSQQEEFFWNSITLISQIYLDNDNDTFPSFYRSFLEHFRESRAFRSLFHHYIARNGKNSFDQAIR